MPTLKIIISGHVQGVCFRSYLKEIAKSIGIKGTVKNEDDGTVVIWASGNRELLQHFLEKCRKGPPASKVLDVLDNWSDGEMKSDDFKIIY